MKYFEKMKYFDDSKQSYKLLTRDHHDHGGVIFFGMVIISSKDFKFDLLHVNFDTNYVQ